jgi:mannose/fructose-specific phosphotransferase system component IIA
LKTLNEWKKNSINEETQFDVISVNVPLLIRLLEWAREDAKTDMQLHELVERALDKKTVLTMADYERLIGK